jgi:hypothetical protein
MATDAKDSPTTKPDTLLPSTRLTPSEIDSLREEFRQMHVRGEAALVAEQARRARLTAEQ